MATHFGEEVELLGMVLMESWWRIWKLATPGCESADISKMKAEVFCQVWRGYCQARGLLHRDDSDNLLQQRISR
ncbi:hypothetical protein CMV_027528 [Castanea mollissima]|uniref:Uncharacterized protein n=1 Tax=Castanea mollissima TaxID=60419 RepID=A0A8J4Q9L0_9ROSI|nr:hypothetical protein CMV_027528 [Castanea mollissima]